MSFILKLKTMITGRKVLIALGLYYGFFFLFYLPSSPLSAMVLKNIPFDQVLDLQKNGYSVEQAKEFLGDLGEVGRSDYLRNLWTLDLLFPLLSVVSTTLLILYCLHKTGLMKWLGFIVCVPIVVMIADYCENIYLTITTVRYPDVINGGIIMASVCTRIKWIGINISFMVTLILLAALVGKVVIGMVRKHGNYRV